MSAAEEQDITLPPVDAQPEPGAPDPASDAELDVPQTPEVML